MNRKLSDWASIAEILSSIAVVVTLIVLIAGIRENTDVLRSSEYSTLIRDLNNFQATQMTDAESVRLWREFRAGTAYGQDMSADDGMRLDLAILVYSRIYEKAYFATRYGLLGESEQARFARVSCSNYNRILGYDKLRLLADTMTDEYMDYLANECGE